MNENAYLKSMVRTLSKRHQSGPRPIENGQKPEGAGLNNASKGIYGHLSLWTNLFMALFLYGCGSSGPQTGSAASTPKPSEAQVMANSTLDCSKSHLVNTWRVSPGYTDTVIVKPNCYFESFQCASVGFLTNDTSAELGIATIQIVWSAQGPFCLSVGQHRCAYDSSRFFYKELDLKCQ